jgi:hypothetical protein
MPSVLCSLRAARLNLESEKEKKRQVPIGGHGAASCREPASAAQN